MLDIKDERILGTVLGINAHGVGTASAFQVSARCGAFASLAMGITGVTFVGLSAFALVTKKDFSFMGPFLFVGILVAFLSMIGALIFTVGPLALTELARSAGIRCDHDGRGGISVTLPYVAPIPWPTLVGTHVVIAVAGGVPIFGLGRLLRRAQERLHQQATHDELTTLPNRRYFVARYAEAWRRAQRLGQTLSLMMCDIDYFKQYNDALGHPAGDECLRIVAGAIRDSLWRAGDFCARYGGEEFVVVLPDTPLESALQVAERISAAVRAHDLAHPRAPAGRVTLSLGVASVTASAATDPETLIGHADAALYRAKAEGRDRIACHPPVAARTITPDGRHE